MRSALVLLLLAGCVISPLPPAKPAPMKPLPAPVWPDACVADWYAKANVPPCVKSWIEDITKEQDSIEKKRKSAKPRP